MPQITTTNRMAILDLIAQADETTEVAGLSASVSQLQIEVAGLSASIGNEINLGDFILVDVPSGVATFSASQSITTSVNDGTNSVSINLDPAGLVAGNQIVSSDGSATNSISFAGNSYMALVRTDGLDSGNISVGNTLINLNITDIPGGGTEQSDISMTKNDTTIFTTNGSATSSQTFNSGTIDFQSQSSTDMSSAQIASTNIQLQSGDGTNAATIDLAGNNNITLTSTDGANTITNLLDATNAVSNITAADGLGNTSSVGIGKTAISLTSTDGAGSGSINLAAGSSSMDQSDGAGSYANISFQSTDATIQSSDGTNTGTIFVENSGSITSTSTDGTNTSTQIIIPTEINSSITDGTSTNSRTSEYDADTHFVSDGTNTSTIITQPTSIQSTVTDGTNTTTQNIGPTGFDTTTTDGANSVAFVADYSQFNIELYDDNVGTTANIGVDTSQSSMGANDGTGTASSIVVQPASIDLTTTDGSTTNQIISDITNGIDITSSDGTNSALHQINTSGFSTTITDGTNTSAEYIQPNNINISTGDGADTSIIDMNKDVLALQSDNTSTGRTSIFVLDPTGAGSADGTYLTTSDGLGTQSTIKCNIVGIENISTDDITISSQFITPTDVIIWNEEISTANKSQLQMTYGQLYYEVYDKITNDKSTLSAVPTLTEIKNENATTGAFNSIILEQQVGLQTIVHDGTNEIYREDIKLDYVKTNFTTGDFTAEIILDPLGNWDQTMIGEKYAAGGTAGSIKFSQGGQAIYTEVTDGVSNISYINIDTTSITSAVSDGTNTSTETITPTQITIEKTDGTYTHKLDFYDTGAIDLFMTNGTNKSGGFYVEPDLTQIYTTGIGEISATSSSMTIDVKPDTLKITGIPVIDLGTYSAFNDAAIAYGLTAGHIYTNHDDLQGLLKIVY